MTDQKTPLANGVELIAEERRRQISEEGWTAEHDDAHRDGELATVASFYAVPPIYRMVYQFKPLAHVPKGWPLTWDAKWWKPCPFDRIHELVKAGALIAAEIDRLQRVKHD